MFTSCTTMGPNLLPSAQSYDVERTFFLNETLHNELSGLSYSLGTLMQQSGTVCSTLHHCSSSYNLFSYEIFIAKKKEKRKKDVLHSVTFLTVWNCKLAFTMSVAYCQIRCKDLTMVAFGSYKWQSMDRFLQCSKQDNIFLVGLCSLCLRSLTPSGLNWHVTLEPNSQNAGNSSQHSYEAVSI